jgi:hypothetical protein
MPPLTGISLSEARSLIAQSGLIYGEVSYAPSTTYDKDIVMSQSPSAYAEVDKNTRVDLVVSLGPEKTKIVTFHLSAYTSDVGGSTVLVEIYLSNYSGGTDLVYNQTRGKNDSISVTFTGRHQNVYAVY